MNRFQGRCHCGAVEWELETRRSAAELPLRQCTCSFCSKHGACCTSDPEGKARIRAARPENLHRYRFGLRTVDFLLCQECGVYLGAYLQTPQGAWVTLNTRALVGAEAFTQQAIKASYDDETAAERRARRQARWTPVVLEEKGESRC